MKIGLAGRSFKLRPVTVMGIVLVVLAIIFLVLSLAAQADIDEIGATEDPALQQRVSELESERDMFLLAGVASLFVGLFSVFVLIEKSLAVPVSESQMIAAAFASGDVVSALSLKGSASYLPAKRGLMREKLFVPAPQGDAQPPSALSDDLTLSPGKDGSTPGVVIEPLGLSFLERIEKELGVSFKDVGVEAAEGQLQILKMGYSLMQDFHFKEREGRMVLRVEYSSLKDACRQVRTARPDTCRQGACFGCSCLLTAAARATGKQVRVEEVDNSSESVVFTFSLVEW